ncbi:MAG: dihydropteroate synthase [Nitrospirales bacterium]|nr:dihydropteroate synthase [Nitrospira sp.]MDR4500200.1 dihydropteroate synthase [Nitrospirales bacterium]
MGILNVTPDSFSDGGNYLDPQKAVDRVSCMIEEGADFIDIGGESTRPGARPVDDQEELHRVKPVLEAIGHRSTVPISIDTRKASVAQMALDLGAVIVNDVSALRYDSRMASVVSDACAGLILMHMQGVPETMQDVPVYENVVRDVKDFLAERLHFAIQEGVARDSILLDPGVGFGKTREHNLALLHQCHQLSDLGRPIVLGVSNKSFIGKITDRPVSQRMAGTAAAVAIGVFQGANILRVHDVGMMRDVCKMAMALRDSAIACAKTSDGEFL